jgi:phosphonate transport system substrate-binding protein
MVDYVIPRLKDLGIEEGEVQLYKSNEDLIQAIQAGKVDWISETPFSAVIFQEKTGAEMVLRRWKKKVSRYNTVFITRKGIGVESLSDLKGKKIAFEDPGSTSAYFIPRALLEREGLELVELENPRDKVPPGKVGYLFAGGELNIATWVHRGLVSAGAFSNLDWDDSDHTPDSFKEKLVIFYQSKFFPRAVELLSKDLDPRIKERIVKILLAADQDPEGRQALKEFNKTKKFDKIDPETREALIEVKELLRYIPSP